MLGGKLFQTFTTRSLKKFSLRKLYMLQIESISGVKINLEARRRKTSE